MNSVSVSLIILAAVLLFLLGYWLFNFLVLYHLNRFGVGTQPKKFAAVFLFGSVALSLAFVLFFANLKVNELAGKLETLGASMTNVIKPQ